MICKNCGFQNAAGDQFCGSCGKFLEWAGEAEDPARESPREEPVSDETQVSSPDNAALPPPPPPPPTQPSSTEATQPLPVQQFSPSLEAGIVCWNCGRQNPSSRSFCQQCGERLAVATSAGAAGGGTARPTGPARTGDGGDRRRVLAIGAGLLAVFLLAGGAAAMLFGDGGGAPGPTPTDAALPGSPSPDVSVEPSPSVDVSPSPTGEAPSESPSASPSPTAGATPTPSPSAPPTAPPTPAPPTPAPTPANCDNLVGASHSLTLTEASPSRQISPNRVWCVTAITFGDGVGDGALKIFLTNPVFLTEQYGYSSARVGWNETFMSDGLFAGSSIESPEMGILDPLLDPTRPYRLLPQGTLIEFEISCADADPCSGAVQIDHDRRPAPPLAP